MSGTNLDRIDTKILQQLAINGRTSNLELANIVRLSPTPCARRVKRLEESGIIRRYAAVTDKQKMGLTLTAYISISMDRHTPDRFENFEAAIQDMTEIVECALVTGQAADYLLKALLPDMAHYEAFLLGKLTKIDGVSGVHSSFVLRELDLSERLPGGPQR